MAVYEMRCMKREMWNIERAVRTTQGMRMGCYEAGPVAHAGEPCSYSIFLRQSHQARMAQMMTHMRQMIPKPCGPSASGMYSRFTFMP